MGKQKSLNFIIPLVVYPFDLMVSLGQTNEQLKNSLSKKDVDWEDNMKIIGRGLFYMNAKNQSILRLDVIPKTPEEYGFLQHEVFHAVTHILNRTGMKMVLMKSDEAYSYLIQYLTSEIYKKL